MPRQMSREEKMEEIARGAIERHLGDVADDPDSIYDEAYTLASDALHDAGYEDGNEVARRIAQNYAQP